MGPRTRAMLLTFGLGTVVGAVLEEIRPELPPSLRKLPDDRLLVLVNWSIIAAW